MFSLANLKLVKALRNKYTPVNTDAAVPSYVRAPDILVPGATGFSYIPNQKTPPFLSEVFPSYVFETLKVTAPQLNSGLALPSFPAAGIPTGGIGSQPLIDPHDFPSIYPVLDGE